MDSRSCGCRLEKKGLSQTQELSKGPGAVRGAFPVGAVGVSLAVQGKHHGLAIVIVLTTVKRVIVSRQLKMMSIDGGSTVRTNNNRLSFETLENRGL